MASLSSSMGGDMLKIIAIITTKNRDKDFFRALDSVKSQSFGPDKIIVVHEEEDQYPLSLSSQIHTTINRRTKSLSGCLLYTSPSPRDGLLSRMPSSA